MAVIKLNASTLATLKCPAGKRRVEYCDSDTAGLYLLVSDTGQRTFYWRTKVDGKTTHSKIGRISDITLADARAEVRRLKEQQTSATKQGNLSSEVLRIEAMTLNDLWDEYYPFAQSTVPRSVKRLEQLWRLRIKPRFGAMRLNDIHVRHIQTFMMDLRKEGLSAATADYHAALLRRMASMAVRWSYLDVNFAKGVQLYHEFNGVENILNDEQLKSLLEVLHTDSNRPICQIVLFLLSTGCRLSEALTARWSNVNEVNKLWIVPAANSKSKRDRSIPLSDSALEILKQIERKESDVYVFTNRKTGTRFKNIFRPWDRIRNKAGVGFFRCHDARHGFASCLVQNGRSLYEVSKLLGHADTRTTQRYAHLNEETLLEAANSITSKLSSVMQLKPKEIPSIAVLV
jgi:integrase